MKVAGRNFLSFFLKFSHGGGDRAVSAAPTENKQPSFFLAEHFCIRNVVGYPLNFFTAKKRHFLMIFRVIAYSSGAIRFFNAADTVLKALGAGDGPGSRERLLITDVGEKRPFSGLGMDDIYFGQFLDFGKLPGFRAIGDISV